RLMPSIGHTPGHTSVLISSNNKRAMITGDFAHHPCQMAHPEWSSTADFDPAAAEATRRRIFGELAAEPVLVIGTHFAGPQAGHVVREGKAFKLVVGAGRRRGSRGAGRSGVVARPGSRNWSGCAAEAMPWPPETGPYSSSHRHGRSAWGKIGD